MTSLMAVPDDESGGTSPFDRIRHVGEGGEEYWLARELMPLLEYPRWNEFRKVIARAVAAAKNTGVSLIEVFREIAENPSEQGGRPRTDYQLSRYGCYLVAMNGDPGKPAIAAAQTYFAIQTWTAEQTAARAIEPSPSSDLDVLQAVVNALPTVVTELRRQREISDDHETRIAALEQAPTPTSALLELEAPFEEQEFTARGYSKLQGFPMDAKSLNALGRKASFLMRKYGKKAPNTRFHAVHGTVGVYPVRYLDVAMIAIHEPEAIDLDTHFANHPEE